MTFRFANVAGRSALVDADGALVRRVEGELAAPSPPIRWTRGDSSTNCTVRRAASADAAPDGHFSDADVRPPIPSPRSVFAVGLNYRSHADESNMDVPPTAAHLHQVPELSRRPQGPRGPRRKHRRLRGGARRRDRPRGSRHQTRTTRGATSAGSRPARTSPTGPCSSRPSPRTSISASPGTPTDRSARSSSPPTLSPSPVTCGSPVTSTASDARRTAPRICIFDIPP